VSASRSAREEEKTRSPGEHPIALGQRSPIVDVFEHMGADDQVGFRPKVSIASMFVARRLARVGSASR